MKVIIAHHVTADAVSAMIGASISRVLKPAGIKVTRLARGLAAVGSDIEYADEVTPAKSY